MGRTEKSYKINDLLKIGLIAFILNWPQAAFSEEHSPSPYKPLIIREESSSSLQKVNWKFASPQLQLWADGSLSVGIQGQYSRKGWTLVYEDLDKNYFALSPDAAKKFTLELPLSGDRMAYQFYALGPGGEKESGRLIIDFRDYEKAITDMREPTPEPKLEPTPEPTPEPRRVTKKKVRAIPTPRPVPRLKVKRNIPRKVEPAVMPKSGHYAELVVSKKYNNLPNLKWEKKFFRVGFRYPSLSLTQLLVLLEGRFMNKDTQLFVGKNAVVLGDKGRFKFKIILKSTVTKLRVRALNSQGKIKTQIIYLRFKKYKSVVSSKRLQRLTGIFITTSLGYRSIGLQQQSLDYGLHALAGNLSLIYQVPKFGIDFAVRASSTLVPLSVSGSAIRARFFDGNVRFGFSLPWIMRPWDLRLLAGLSYSSMLNVPAKAFGYSGLLFPEINPLLKYRFKNGDGGYANIRYIPLASGFGLSFTSRKIGIGLGYEVALRNSHAILYELEVSDMDLVQPNSTISTFDAGVSVGYTW